MSTGSTLLSIVGGIIGAAIGFAVGGPAGAFYGFSVGMTIGGIAGSALYPDSPSMPKPIPGGLEIQTSQYGSVIPYLRGKRKMAGNLLWYGDFQPHEITQEVSTGLFSSEEVTTGYWYSVSAAFGLCYGPAAVRRIWANKNEILCKLTAQADGVWSYTLYRWEPVNVPDIFDPAYDPNGFKIYGYMRVHTGDHTTANSYLAGFVPRAPVWPGLCYAVLGNFRLGESPYMPNIQFEVATLQAVVPPLLPNVNHLMLDTAAGLLFAVQDFHETYVEGGITYPADPAFTSRAARIRIFDPESFREIEQPIYLDAQKELQVVWTQQSLDSKYLFLASTDGQTSYLRRIDVQARTSELVTLTMMAGGLVANAVCVSGWTDATHTTGNDLYFGTTTGQLLRFPIDTFPLGYEATYVRGVELGNESSSNMSYQLDQYGMWVPEYGGNTQGSTIQALAFNNYTRELVFLITGFIPNAIIALSLPETVGDPYQGLGFFRYSSLASVLPLQPIQVLSLLYDGYAPMALASIGRSVWQVMGRHPTSNGFRGPLTYPFYPEETTLLPPVYELSYSWTQAVFGAGTPFNGVYTSIDGLPSIYVDITDSTVSGTSRRERYSIEGTILSSSDRTTWGTRAGVFWPEQDMIVAIGDDNYLHLVDAQSMDEIEYTMAPESDVTPPEVTAQILTNDFYGAGIDAAVLDAAAFAQTEDDCIERDHFCAINIASQVSILDALQHLISHHQGYITYRDGLIAHRQLKSEPSSVSLTMASLVQEGTGLPIAVTRPGQRDVQNRINVEYTNRSGDYVTGICTDEDFNDIDAYGLQEVTRKLDGLTTFRRAGIMASLLLRRSLANPHTFSFKLGPRHMGLGPGDVFDLTSASLELSARQMRVMAVAEQPDSVISVTAEEELEIYTLPTNLPTTTYSFSTDTGSELLIGLAEAPLYVELPPHYTDQNTLLAVWNQPDSTTVSGVALHRSYLSGASYARMSLVYRFGNLGAVTAIDYADGTITVEFPVDTVLTSATDRDELQQWPNRNLVIIEDLRGRAWFCRFVTADLVSGSTWTLSDIMTDCAGTPRYGYLLPFAVGCRVALGSTIPLEYKLQPVDQGRELLLKAATVSFSGTVQALSAVTETAYTTNYLPQRPLAPFGVVVNGLPVETRRI
jgi:hypothetical protein